MKILFNCSEPLALGIRRRLFEEGNDVFSQHYGGDEPELTLTDDLTDNISQSVGIFIRLPQFVRDSIVDYSESHIPHTLQKFCVSRWWDGEVYTSQILISFPVFGQFNDNLGKQDCVGVAARYLSEVSYVKFEQEPLIQFLQNIKHVGFVTFVFQEAKLDSVHLGIPFLGMYNALAGVAGKLLTPWFLEPSRLLESWTVSLLVTTESTEACSKVQLDSNSRSQVWWLTNSQRMDSFVPRQNEIAVVTSWGQRIRDAAQLTLESARLLNVKNKLYRTDVASQVERTVEELKKAQS